MVATIAAASLLLQAKTEMTTPEVVSVSMFKNGFAFVTRKIRLKEGSANIVQVPQASLGTLWFWTDEGELKRIVTADQRTTTKQEVSLKNFNEIVEKNVGKTVYVESEKASPQTGKIRASDGSVLVLETENGVTVIEKSTIKFLKTQDAGFVWKQMVDTNTDQKFYSIETDKGAKEVMLMSLERGVTWAPGYAVDLSNPEKLTLASKATIFNDLTDLSGINVRLITGFPNLQFKDILDPFTAGMSGDNWLNTLGAGGTPGGFGGRGRPMEMMTQNAMAPKYDADVNWGGPDASTAGGEQVGDLFFYDLPKFNTKKGSRVYQNLFKFQADYKHIYTWEIDDQVDANGNYRPVPTNQVQPEEVWHTIRFKNSSGKPLTTAASTIFGKGELLGQTMMNYVAAGADCDLKINKALEVRAEASEEEVSRDRGAIKDQYNNPRWDLVTVKGTLEATNGRSETIQMKIQKSITGEYVSGLGEPSVTKTTKGLRQMNSSSKLVWKPLVKAGDKLRLDYTYKLYVPSN